MALFLAMLAHPSEDHRVEAVDGGFLMLPKPGREVPFDALARRVVDHVGPFAAFARKDESGRYDSVHILPEASA
jgi:hypothetical protein